MTNKSSTLPKTPLECPRHDLLEAGESDMGLQGISAACVDGNWQFLSGPEYLGVAQNCQAGHEPENSLQLL